ncbi:PREDICTED: trehalose import ATP-binding protein SugC-like, partial [Cyphomyrmex costatus]|uniref:trehalose import ATP-binding protein SugC-like n=1 Tax=Cyphomyrmex costatus TaxID=456900 RepID=UPI00085228A1
MATSDADEALASADQVAVLHQGFVHQVGTPRELYERPADMFVAGYLGAPPMNLVPGFPVEGGIETPLGLANLSRAALQGVGEREVVVLGIRPEHLSEAATPNAFTFEASIDDSEWRGRSQFAYVGYDIAPAVEAVLSEVEELIEFDLFQSFVMAELPADRALETGRGVTLSVAAKDLHVFDPVTGENLTHGTSG